LAAQGGGVYFSFSSSSTLEGCILIGNLAASGGGIHCYNSSPLLINCTITGNSAYQRFGGGIRAYYFSSPTLINCTLSNNSAGYGGGINCSAFSSAEAINSILWGNTANVSGAEVYLTDFSCSVAISYSDVDPELIAGLGQVELNNNINADPLFIGMGNYHLREESPCIDAGRGGADIPVEDIDGDPRPYGEGYDIGADEYVPGGLKINVTVDKGDYTTGETMHVTVEITADDAAVTADVYLRLRLPDESCYYYPTWSAAPTPAVSSWPVADWGPKEVFRHTFTGLEPAGEYVWEAALIDPDTGDIIGEPGTANFIFLP